jgi:hypothetical protein
MPIIARTPRILVLVLMLALLVFLIVSVVILPAMHHAVMGHVLAFSPDFIGHGH